MDRHTGRIVGTLNQSPGLQQQTRGGLRAVRQPAVVNLAGDGGKASVNDKARRFPSLTVVARTQKVAPNLSAKRGELDNKVKALLVQPAAKFTEWLIKEGLVPPEQYCRDTKAKLKLGKYSDNKKFAHSGGYVWVDQRGGEQKQYTSVFKGSLFEASTHSPTVVLKLIYHWSCQTNIQNVVQWVKVDYTVINLFFQMIRSVCVASVQEEIVNMGGPGKEVEAGVISLGTVSEDGKKRQVSTISSRLTLWTGMNDSFIIFRCVSSAFMTARQAISDYAQPSPVLGMSGSNRSWHLCRSGCAKAPPSSRTTSSTTIASDPWDTRSRFRTTRLADTTSTSWTT